MYDGLVGGMLGLVGTQLAASHNAALQEDQQDFNAEQAAISSERQYEYWRKQNNAIYAAPLQALREGLTQQEIEKKYKRYEKAFQNEKNYLGYDDNDNPFIEATNLLGQKKKVSSIEDAMSWWQYGRSAEDVENAQNGGGYQYQANAANLDYIRQIPTAQRQGLVDAGYNPLSAFDVNAASQPAMSTAASNINSQAQSGIGHGMDAQAFVSAAKNIIDSLNETRLTNAQTQNINADTKLKDAQTKDIADERNQRTANYELELQKYDLENKRLAIDASKIHTEIKQIENIIDLDNQKMSLEKKKLILDFLDVGLKHAEKIGVLLKGLNAFGVAEEKISKLVKHFKKYFS